VHGQNLQSRNSHKAGCVKDRALMRLSTMVASEYDGLYVQNSRECGILLTSLLPHTRPER